MDKIAIVTGAGRGIGQAIGLELAERGYGLVLNDLDFSDEAKKAFSAYDRVSFSQGDVSLADYCQDLCQKAQDMGGLYLIVNNAGINRDGLLVRMKEEDFDDVIRVNLKSCYNMMKAGARFMMKNRAGRIINMSSVVGLHGNAGQANYAASKAGIIGLTKSAAKELAGRNILVNAIAPGFIETDMTDELGEDLQEEIKGAVPLARFGQAQEVASLVGFLASDEAAYITGQTISIDGGMSI